MGNNFKQKWDFVATLQTKIQQQSAKFPGANQEPLHKTKNHLKERASLSNSNTNN